MRLQTALPLVPRTLTTFAALAALLGGLAFGQDQAEKLTIGSPAPSIDVEHWFHDFEPVNTFEKGKVYVVEFWATWCGPCVASMPLLAAIQQKYPDDLMVISISGEDPEKIEEFLDRKKGEETYREITSAYRLATDPDRSVNNDYMRAAGQNGIPTAFLVGKTGEIEWIGHPMRMEDPVAKVITGQWDRAAYAKQMEEENTVRQQLKLVSEKLRQGQRDEAITMLDKLIAETPSPKARESFEAAQRRVRAETDDLARPTRGATPVEFQQLAIGDQVTLRLTGRTNGAVWGDSIYTLDSDLSTAAVHAGLVRAGETKAIKVWIVPAPTSFAEANRNGVRSRKWGAFRAAFVMQAAMPAAPRPMTAFPTRVSADISALAIGDSKTVTLTGSDRGPLWGTDTYTGDSSLAAAAVHFGALRSGQTGDVVVTRVAPPVNFQGSVRNGVHSSSWGAYPSAFTVDSAAPKRP